MLLDGLRVPLTRPALIAPACAPSHPFAPERRKEKGLGKRQALDPVGAGEESRTPDLRITNALLYQLSYTGESRAFYQSAGTALRRARYFSANAGSFFGTAAFFSVTYFGSPSFA